MFSTSYPDPFLQWYCGSVGFFSFQMALLKLIATSRQGSWVWHLARAALRVLWSVWLKCPCWFIDLLLLMLLFILYNIPSWNVLIYSLGYRKLFRNFPVWLRSAVACFCLDLEALCTPGCSICPGRKIWHAGDFRKTCLHFDVRKLDKPISGW